jgi:2-isopropylmalate synthase
MRKISIYDTTLRDGTQAEEINLSTEDKIRVAKELDTLGLDYIEGGWPGSNVTDKKFFKEIKQYELKHSKIAAFASTHNPKRSAENDPNLHALVESGADVATLFGKTWDLHVTEALRTSLDRNLELIAGSVAHVRPHFPELIFDAEHFFDGFKANPEFTLACLKKAAEAGAEVIVLCDTNGGTMPREISEIMRRVKEELPGSALGIHCHNDSDMAVANTIQALAEGAVQVQGTINGYGERCGNANLCSILPNLAFKYGDEYQFLAKEHLDRLTGVSRYISEICNLRPFMRQPFVGRSAFAHKGGIHVSAVLKDPRTYEHIPPESVGNEQRVLLSDLSGRSNILFMADKYGYKLNKDDPAVMDLLARVKEHESMGYEYSAAEASFELLFYRTMGWSKQYFKLLNYRVVDALQEKAEQPFIEATVMIRVRGSVEHTAATGQGPVNALDNALRKALEAFYPNLREMRLSDFKVRVLSGTQRDTGGTASVVRVLIESQDKTSRWTTIGVSYDVIDASWRALVDSFNYKLFKDDPKKWPDKRPAGKP